MSLYESVKYEANLPPYGNGTLPPGIRSRRIANVNGLTVHILEAGYEVPGRPAVLLHGFPEFAYRALPMLIGRGGSMLGGISREQKPCELSRAPAYPLKL
ncbi:MAG: hypothetical protein JOZ80_00680 [Acidobacteriaceae bacterium]|nr:hypothetical protein [Acidobacteriaceae bacterium]